jgi:hypothetical protein
MPPPAPKIKKRTEGFCRPMSPGRQLGLPRIERMDSGSMKWGKKLSVGRTSEQFHEGKNKRELRAIGRDKRKKRKKKEKRGKM